MRITLPDVSLKNKTMPVHLLGIRHHGPGSCRNVVEALQTLKPDLILLEGPAEAEPLIHFVTDEQMKPPVALLAYQPDCPQNAVFYPFAEFSPEWQTLCYAVRNGIPLQFFDLPLAYAMPLEYPTPETTMSTEKEEGQETKEEAEEETATAIQETFTGDPFDYLAEAAGYTDGESWSQPKHEILCENSLVKLELLGVCSCQYILQAQLHVGDNHGSAQIAKAQESCPKTPSKNGVFV